MRKKLIVALLTVLCAGYLSSDTITDLYCKAVPNDCIEGK